MKIIDFEPKGNAIRFYLGDDECNDYWGDDWNDRPYEHNAGIVYDRFIKSTADVFVDLDLAVLVPEDDWNYGGNSPFSKEDFKNRIAPCVVIAEYTGWDETYSKAALQEDVKKFYFNDTLEPGHYIYKKTITNQAGLFKID